MSYVQDWDFADIIRQIKRASSQVSSPYNDGYTSFEVKKDLIKFQYEFQEIMNSLPTFTGEEEFRDKLDQEITFNILKNS